MSDAGEGGVASLCDGDVSTGQLLVNVWRNQDGDTANLLLHLLGVDLTHVAVLILHSHISVIANHISSNIDLINRKSEANIQISYMIQTTRFRLFMRIPLKCHSYNSFT